MAWGLPAPTRRETKEAVCDHYAALQIRHVCAAEAAKDAGEWDRFSDHIAAIDITARAWRAEMCEPVSRDTDA